MQPGLVREGSPTGVRLVGVGGDVGDLGDGVRDADRLLQRAVGQAVDAEFDLQVGDHHEKVGVAGALAVAVGRDLHVGGAGLDSGHRVGDGTTGVVLAVDAQSHARSLAHIGDDLRNAVRQHAAVGVAEDSDRCARVGGCAQQTHAVVGIVLVSVEEVLHVDKHPTSFGDEVGHSVRDHVDVFVE